ncbi:GIY-YIG nuclease family protein [Cryomorpha ignava]|uniref:GIY-YIG nuclease family protein n=1 Tax=Cryomorpha ignava TaxID=101383 RepID=A0A7K3WTN3_9FLAO|nr:GIY-YIG nuclease family protein [Cryomorpha ignava]NEN25053.1 GIY-YIG nuclease family protein [Cryomorpha ignava]
MVVYILYSNSIQQFYAGSSADFDNRLIRHNAGRSKSTKKGIPWHVVRIIHCKSRSEAVIPEIKIKKRGIQRWLLDNMSEFRENREISYLNLYCILNASRRRGKVVGSNLAKRFHDR